MAALTKETEQGVQEWEGVAMATGSEDATKAPTATLKVAASGVHWGEDYVLPWEAIVLHAVDKANGCVYAQVDVAVERQGGGAGGAGGAGGLGLMAAASAEAQASGNTIFLGSAGVEQDEDGDEIMEIEDIRFHAAEESLNGIFNAMCEGASRASKAAAEAAEAAAGAAEGEQGEGGDDAEADASMAALMQFVANGGEGFFGGGAAGEGEAVSAGAEDAAAAAAAASVDLSSLSAGEIAALPLELRAADEAEMTEDAAATMHRLAAMLEASEASAEESAKQRFADAE